MWGGVNTIKPIIACRNPYKTAEKFSKAGWNLDFSNPPESGDPLVGISLFDNSILLGVMEGYVSAEEEPHVGCGVEIYLTVPRNEIQKVHSQHQNMVPTALTLQPWGDVAFEISVDGYRFMIASE